MADLFCGAGGTSTGAERAIKRLGGEMVLAAVNHWPIAIETHQRNHPTARHYVEDVTVADPERIVPEGRLDLLMASPECRFYSRARGGKPVHDQGRMNPWIVHRWLSALDVRCILIENVPEFVEWGPLLASGRPDPAQSGIYFQAWMQALWKMGYAAEWRMLNAADFGDATTRIRFFLQARKDGRPIVWPEPSHSATGVATMVDGRAKWRSAREVIDWSNLGRSLLDDPRYKRKPLSEKTRARIARGLQRFGGPLAPLYIRLLGVDVPANGNGNGHAKPFVMGKQSNPAYRSADEPIPTLTTEGGLLFVHPTTEPLVGANRNNNVPKPADQPIPAITTAHGGGLYMVRPTVKPFVLGQQSGGAPRSTEKPLPTVAADGAVSLVAPTLIHYYGADGGGHSVEAPLGTVTTKDRFGLVDPVAKPFILGQRASARARAADEEPVPTITTTSRGIALVRPFLVPQFGEAPGQAPRVHDVEEPAPAVTSHGAGALVNPVLVEVNHDGERPSRPLDAPLGTLTTKRGTGLVNPVMVQIDQLRNGNGARSIDDPIPTLVTKANVALAEPILRQVEEGEVDPARLVLIDGEPYVLDIRFRMLTNGELARAMGFSDDETTYEFVGNVAEVTKQIGNAVPVGTACALVSAVLGPALAEGAVA